MKITELISKGREATALARIYIKASDGSTVDIQRSAIEDLVYLLTVAINTVEAQQERISEYRQGREGLK